MQECTLLKTLVLSVEEQETNERETIEVSIEENFSEDFDFRIVQ